MPAKVRMPSGARVPSVVQEELQEYMNMLDARFPGMLEGLYLHGSIALNAFVDGASDIDFIAVTKRTPNPKDVQALADIHQSIARKYQNHRMDGQYLVRADMGRLDAAPCLYCRDNGKLVWVDQGPNPVTWWILQTSGITIAGPALDTYRINVDIERLVGYVLSNMNTYWVKRMRRMQKGRLAVLLLPNRLVEWEVQWSISGILRQYYTLREHRITSKLGACEYALQHVPETWHDVINDAISIRKGQKARCCRSKLHRINQTVECMKYIINHCNSMFS